MQCVSIHFPCFLLFLFFCNNEKLHAAHIRPIVRHIVPVYATHPKSAFAHNTLCNPHIYIKIEKKDREQSKKAFVFLLPNLFSGMHKYDLYATTTRITVVRLRCCCRLSFYSAINHCIQPAMSE